MECNLSTLRLVTGANANILHLRCYAPLMGRYNGYATLQLRLIMFGIAGDGCARGGEEGVLHEHQPVALTFGFCSLDFDMRVLGIKNCKK